MKGESMVYRKTAIGTVVADVPSKPMLTETEAQSLHRDRFRLAGFYALRVKDDPFLVRLYEDLPEKVHQMSGS